MISLVLLAVSPAQGEDADSLQLFLQQGDSCMLQYNTFDALHYYQRAFNYAEAQNVVQFSMEDADVHSKYMPEDRTPTIARPPNC